MEFGDEQSQKEVIENFLDADPHHGELWTKEVKRVENWRKNPVELLKKVAKNLELFDLT
jgi:hypothetical protein